MNKKDLHTVLAYDRFHNNQISTFERMLTHQHINQRILLPKELRNKLHTIYTIVETTNWKTPETRYNQNRELEVYNQESNRWENFSTYKNASLYDNPQEQVK